MGKEISLVFIILWYSIAVFATIFYLYGYFPVKTSGFHKEHMDPPWNIEGVEVDAIKIYKPEIERLVIVVIDGIRMDFVNGHQMPHLMTAIEKANGCVIKVHAEAPTVTMPRIKAITTGSVPQFIDIALNLGSGKLLEDSFLHRLKDMKKSVVFYGDNTWKFLFPDIFLRYDGVNSFYVTDFTEVDNNVTRHLPTELSKKDWSVMILHYLGLDHIGHVHGPFSPLIDKKLAEMDEIIKNITISLGNLNDTAILVTGDHGMRDAGSHGGVTPPEIEVPFAWIGKCPRKDLSHNRTYERQTDIAVTLSALMGISYPYDNVGVLMPQLFGGDVEMLLYKYYYNAQNLISKKRKHSSLFSQCFTMHMLFLTEGTFAKETVECYEKILRNTSDLLVRDISTQILPYLIISTVILFWCLLAVALPAKNKLYLISTLISIAAFSIEYFLYTSQFSILLASILLALCLINALGDFEKIIFSAINADFTEQTFGIGSIIGTLCLMSSSFVEEEHQIWLFFIGTFIFCNVFKYYGENTINGKWIASFVFLRFLRNLKSLGETLKIAEHNEYLKLLLIFGLLGTFLCIIFHSKGTKKSSLINLTIMILIYLYKMHFPNGEIVISFWILTILNVIFEIKNMRNTFPCIWMQIIALFMRPWNVILLPGFYISSQTILKYSPSLFIKVMAHIWLIRVFFNGQGFDNSIGSVDISPGYIGLSDYYPFLAGIQVFCHYYAFYILGYLILLTYFKTRREIVQMFRICTIYKLFDILYYCVITIIHRDHLFIWSVFAPKLIIEAAHTALLLIVLYCYYAIKGF